MRAVTKCVCKRVTFQQVKEQAEERGLTTLEEVITEGLCATGCGMCRPYVHKMLVTGEVEFAPGDVYLPVVEKK